MKRGNAEFQDAKFLAGELLLPDLHSPKFNARDTMKTGLFDQFAKSTASISGRPITFGIAIALIVIWGISGPVFGFSDTWQLVINTGTTIITFLMVFLIQNTQNRDSHAVQLKLDELIRATDGAHVILLDVEEICEADLKNIRKAYSKLAAKGRHDIKKGGQDTGTPTVDLSAFESKPEQ